MTQPFMKVVTVVALWWLFAFVLFCFVLRIRSFPIWRTIDFHKVPTYCSQPLGVYH